MGNSGGLREERWSAHKVSAPPLLSFARFGIPHCDNLFLNLSGVNVLIRYGRAPYWRSRKAISIPKGNVYLKTALVEAANAAAKPKGTYLRDKFYRLKARRGYERA